MDEQQIPVIATMHDAVTAYCKEEHAEEMAIAMKECMKQASANILKRDIMKIGEPEIIRHGDFWIHGEKAERDWPKYKKYFINDK
jgi:uncharacterized ferredoxin-like protein